MNAHSVGPTTQASTPPITSPAPEPASTQGGIPPYPLAALVGCDDLRLALLLNAVHPAIGGVLVRGEKGTAKSTAVRGLAALLPQVAEVEGCRFACDPAAPDPGCPDGPHPAGTGARLRPARLVELPVGASEDRVAGALDLERALLEGTRAFEPGLLALAHRGVLYVDEVNLLGDHLVDLLLDAAAMGTNHVEREGVSVRHAARFQLVGTMNPEEGELRPQLLDRFGLTVEVRASRDPAERMEVVRRRLAYEADPAGFAAAWAGAGAALAERVRAARRRLAGVRLGEAALRAVAAACTAFEVDGLRADLVTAKGAVALAAWSGRDAVTIEDVRTAALLALPHRRRRGPFEQPGIDPDRLDEALAGIDDDPPDGGGPDGGADRRPPATRPDPSDGPASGGGGDPGNGTGSDTRNDHGSDRANDGGLDGPDRDGPAPDATAGRGDGPGRPDPAEQGSGAPAAQGTAQPGGAAIVLPVGAVFDPVLLTVEGTGVGAWGRRSPARGDRGRHVADRRPAASPGDLALVATLRAAAPHQHARGRAGAGLVLARGDLREKVREGREGNLVLFVVDASGSMAARRRMVAVKGAVLSLLLDAYQRRDRIGLITFRGKGAELAVPPTASVELAARLLDGLPTGGRTPLAAGLERAAEVLAAERVRDPDRRPLLILVTDGRATGPGGPAMAEAAAAGLAARKVPGVVVDTEEGAVRLALAGRVAAALGAPWLRLEELAADGLAGVVRGFRRAGGRAA